MKQQQKQQQKQRKTERLFKNNFFFGFILFVVTSCSLTDNKPITPSIEDDQMSIKDAKSTLGNLTNIGMINTKGSESNQIADVSGNEIHWDTAKESRFGTKDQVEVLFSRKFSRLFAVHTNTEQGVDTPYTSEVTQKLIFHRNTAVSDSIYLYVMSLIPHRVYNEQYSGDISYLFENFGEKNNFSGHVLYNNYQTGNLREITYYMDGKQVFLYNLGHGDKATYETSIKCMKLVLDGIKIYRESAQTRVVTLYMDEVNVYGSGYNGEDIESNWCSTREASMQNCISGGGNASITK